MAVHANSGQSDRKLKRLHRMTNEELIALACRCEQDLIHAHQEKEIILGILGERFPGAKTEEMIVTPKGIAKRVVRNTYVIDSKRIEELRRILGPTYMEMVDEDVSYSITPEGVAEVKRTFGIRAEEFLLMSVRAVATKLFRSRLKSSDQLRAEVGDAVTVKTTTTITVAPSEE